jgi:hypothetical protein
VKDGTSRIKNICGINTNINAERFGLNLSKHITEDMPVYSELESCIFQRQ